MSTQFTPAFSIRDAQGNIYGPADAAMLRDWVAQGRIVAGMHIAERGTDAWVEASQHPAIADLLGGSKTASIGNVTVVESMPAAPNPTPSTQQLMTYESPKNSPRNGLATWAMITGICAPVISLIGCVPICGCVFVPLGILCALTAIVLGSIAFYLQRSKPEQYTGRGAAITGVCLGIFTLLMYGLSVVYFIIASVTSRP